MRAVVLVGGRGTRLRPLTETLAKPLLPVVEVTIIERVLAHLAGHGIDEVVLSMGYQPDGFLAAFPQGRAAGVALHYAIEPEPLDTAGAIRFAALDAGIDETFVVVNGDVLTDHDLGALVAFHQSAGAEATLRLTPVEDPSRFGVVVVDEDGLVRLFVEKPPPGTSPSNLVNAGTYVLEPRVIDRIEGGRRVSVERDTFPAIVADGRLFALSSDAYWLDLGTPASYLRANTDLLCGVRGGLSGGVEISPGVWLEDDAVAPEHGIATSWFGVGSSAEDGATLEASVVGAGARVATGATIRGSVLLPGAEVDTDAVVEASIVGPGARVGAGAHLVGCVVGADMVAAAESVLIDARLPKPS